MNLYMNDTAETRLSEARRSLDDPESIPIELRYDFTSRLS